MQNAAPRKKVGLGPLEVNYILEADDSAWNCG